MFGEHRAGLELQTEIRAEAATGFFEPDNPARIVEHDQPRADVECGESITLPSAQTAIFEVPPPISTLISGAPLRIERAAAPEP